MSTRRATPAEIREAARAGLDAPHKPAGPFRWAAFGQAASRDLREANIYAIERLPMVGRGAGRVVYALDDARVLKVAWTDYGVRQNRSEIVISRDPRARAGVAVVLSSDKGGRWVVAERARPISEDALSEALGGPLDALDGALDGALDLEHPTADEALREMQVAALTMYRPDMRVIANSPVLPFIAYLIARHGLGATDLARREQWGVAPDGRLVIVDYGAR